ncbi:hypothetical protein ACTZWT_20395 [Rhodopseudomonas sp. NSM]|uniref:hypothetical protein n=1 Tax=Rhodopseudomonas sp. NSM TaxID=3457630 RepID=UPI004036B6FE
MRTAEAAAFLAGLAGADLRDGGLREVLTERAVLALRVVTDFGMDTFDMARECIAKRY